MEGSHLKVQWTTHSNVLVQQINHRFSQQQFVDVVLLCEGQTINCHRLVLAASSLYFEQVLSELPMSDLVLVLGGMKFSELKALVTLMYTGEVTVRQDRLKDLRMVAEKLKIKGLSNLVDKSSTAPSRRGEGNAGQGILLNVFCNREGMVDLLHDGRKARAVLKAKLPKQTKRPESVKLSQPKKLRHILPKMVNEETKGIRKRELELPQMPTLFKRPNFGQPNHVGVILPSGLRTPGIGAKRESGVNAGGVAIVGLFPEGAAAATQYGANFAGNKNNQLMFMQAPSSALLTTTQSGIPFGQFLETASQPCQPFTMSSSPMEMQPKGRPYYSTFESERRQRFEKAALKALKIKNTTKAAAEFNIPRTTLIHYMKRQREDTMLHPVEIQDLLEPVSVANGFKTRRTSADGNRISSTFTTTNLGHTNRNGLHLHYVKNNVGLSGYEVANLNH